MKIFTPDTSRLATAEEKGKFIMAWRLNIIFIIIFSILAIATIPIDIYVSFVYAAVALLSIVIFIYLNITGKSRKAYWIYTIAGSLFAEFTINNFLETAHYSDFVWILTTIIFAYVGLGRRAGISLIIFHIIGLSYYVAFNIDAHFIEVGMQSTTEKLVVLTEITFGMITIGYLLNQHLVFQTYTRRQMRKLNESLEEQNEIVLVKNEENITLVKEVHHRVKNNLQIIISLLRMQRSEIDNEEAKEHFNVAINRILTMSMIHQKLYQEKEPSRINIKDYLEDLTNELISLSNRQPAVKIKLIAKKEYADLKTIVPFGLLINELVANSMKHAFDGGENDVITIELKSNKHHKRLDFTYSDNGKWREPEKEDSGFGLELIDILTEQLEGTYTRTGSIYSFEIRQEP